LLTRGGKARQNDRENRQYEAGMSHVPYPPPEIRFSRRGQIYQNARETTSAKPAE